MNKNVSFNRKKASEAYAPYENEHRKSKKGIIIRLASYVLGHPVLFITAIVFTLLSNQLALMGPEFSGAAVDAIVEEGGVNFSLVYENVIKMIICYAVSAILSYFLSVIMVTLGQKIVYTMRKQVFEKLNTLPVVYFDTHPTGDIVSRISYDIDTVNGSLSHDLVQVMTSIYTVIGSLIFMWRISKPMIIVFAITVPISLLFTRYRSKKVRPLFRMRSRKLGELNGYAEEMLSGCRSISAYGREDVISERFKSKNKETMEAYYHAEYYGTTLGPGVNFINNLSISLVAMLGGILYMLSKSEAVAVGTAFFITLGGVTKFVMYSRKFAGPINEFANILHEFQSAFSAAERIFKVLDEEPEPLDSEEAESLSSVDGRVELSHVDFGYTKEKTILKDVSLLASPGKSFAIVGPTGAGKTTIINLLMRFYDINSGSVTIDGKDIRSVKRKDLRRAYTMVLQDTWLFNGTIYDNIVYGKENATEAEVKRAAEMAMIDTYIEGLPEGYNTVISDEGINISKGQRQLITIARAFLSDAPMLILDEATSNVDSRTEIKIQQAMDKLTKGRTSFIIAHRLSTIQNADTIVVLRDGTVSEMGSHGELMQSGGFYSTLYRSQFS